MCDEVACDLRDGLLGTEERVEPCADVLVEVVAECSQANEAVDVVDRDPISITEIQLPLPSSKYATTCSAVILFVSAIVVTPLVVVSEGLDESERLGGRTLDRLRPTLSYTTLWDVTPGPI